MLSWTLAEMGVWPILTNAVVNTFSTDLNVSIDMHVTTISLQQGQLKRLSKTNILSLFSSLFRAGVRLTKAINQAPNMPRASNHHVMVTGTNKHPPSEALHSPPPRWSLFLLAHLQSVVSMQGAIAAISNAAFCRHCSRPPAMWAFFDQTDR